MEERMQFERYIALKYGLIDERGQSFLVSAEVILRALNEARSSAAKSECEFDPDHLYHTSYLNPGTGGN
jgi:hypothetical protein